MENADEVIQQQATKAIEQLGVQDFVSAAEVAGSILQQAVYWERPLPDGDRLLFVRLFSPVVMREEVFLGNVLFNDFLAKAFARAASRDDSAVVPVADDLENHYFIARTSSDLPTLAESLRTEVERCLPELFFGEPNPARGIHGDLRGMFTFRKSDFEPFPVYSVPQFLDREMERAIRREVSRLIQPEAFSAKTTPRTVMAALAFFYGRTSGGAGDAQSFASFIDHLVNDMDYGSLLEKAAVTRAFNVSEATKQQVKQSVDEETFSREALRLLLRALLDKFAASIERGEDKWLLGYLRQKGKFLSAIPEEYLMLLLQDVQFGYLLMPKQQLGGLVVCRLCHTTTVTVADSYIVTGLTSFKFHNQSVRNIDEKMCGRCALHAYLAQKLLGTAMVSTGGKLPQIPKTYNLIFHYGRHSDAEVAHLVQRIDRVWELVRKHREADTVRSEIVQARKSLAQKLEREQNAEKRVIIEAELAKKQTEIQQAQAAIAQVEDDIFADCPWMRDAGASPTPTENPALDIIGNLQLSESRVERHVLGLGTGGYRLILFVMPQIRPPRKAKEHDYAQSRFSNSWITVTAFLSFLHSLCGCDGPYYYQSLPVLAAEAFQSGTFYIRNRAISAEQAQDKYKAIYELAWRLIWQRGPEGFVKKVMLAEKMLADPLGTFSTVMRDSPILGQSKGDYKRLKTEHRPDWGAQDLTEYARFIQHLSDL